MTFHLQEECQLLQQDIESYPIANDHDVRSMDQPTGLFIDAIEATAQSSDSITADEVFDVYRSLLKGVEVLQPVTMIKLFDALSSGFLAEVDSTQRTIDAGDAEPASISEHKPPLERYAFLLQWFVLAADKVSQSHGAASPVKPKRGAKGKGAAKKKAAEDSGANWTWETHIPATLALVSKVLRLKTHRIWTTTAEKDAFINCMTRPAYYITESEAYMKREEIRLGVYKVICLAVKHHGHGFGAQISIMQCLQYFEHLSEPMAEALTVLAKEFDHSQLAEEILREIAGKQFSGQDTKGPRSFSRFLVRFAELSPRIFLKQISLLLVHLDSESYPMRMALVEIIGMLIKEIAMSEEGEQESREKKINSLFELLTERFLDLSSYVRAKVINTLGKLCDLPVKFPKQRLLITELVISSLEDKASSVRRYAIALLTKLILTHPYGLMHGGLLRIEEWETRYKAVTEELEKIETKEMEKPAVEKEEDGDEEGDEEDETQEDDDETQDDEAATPRKKKYKKRNPDNSESMDIDEGFDEEMDEDTEDETQGDEDSMDQDPDATPRKTASKSSKDKKSKKKKKSRKSDALDLSALTNEQAALAALEGNHLLHLRLRKRYYAEGLNFIKRIEGGMDILCQLLGSKNKPEVLEAMEFFRVAHEYQFTNAELGIKKMLHLIWSKDNTSTTEDGNELKGIRSRLIECYRSLYFDPLANMDPKQQVNRIAKNLIQLTYDATLAELTSLEELVRTMVQDEQIHIDVINKLWQVYMSDKSLPKEQRRGTILILGMMATAKRGIVSDRVEVLLKVGLGPFGKVGSI
ncbi:hypothetical protein M422DRAFT_178703 [Sphaerobolus stellatus SS14]|uniref:Condensin complex subunit 1 N-terminal domain-containing protein n=1 Tax=Sphaerobolus stellatus (strain SS14) TaxID=990650 RepID=A0A0C9VI60_SPHS4|nr:hypothetical protein M422DRAFT_178703 [Sphaerobolus stellatus SS14]